MGPTFFSCHKACFSRSHTHKIKGFCSLFKRTKESSFRSLQSPKKAFLYNQQMRFKDNLFQNGQESSVIRIIRLFLAHFCQKLSLEGWRTFAPQKLCPTIFCPWDFCPLVFYPPDFFANWTHAHQTFPHRSFGHCTFVRRIFKQVPWAKVLGAKVRQPLRKALTHPNNDFLDHRGKQHTWH